MASMASRPGRQARRIRAAAIVTTTMIITIFSHFRRLRGTAGEGEGWLSSCFFLNSMGVLPFSVQSKISFSIIQRKGEHCLNIYRKSFEHAGKPGGGKAGRRLKKSLPSE